MKYALFIVFLGFGLCGSLFAKIIKAKKLSSLSKVACPLSGKINPILPKITRYRVSYETKDFFGNDTIASGLIALPSSNKKNLSPLLYLHATAASKSSVPSMNSIEARFVACTSIQNKRVMIAPDYLGLGSNKGDHPYMMSDITVSSSLDLLNAAYEWLKNKKVSVNRNLILAGYSQGGHAALAIHKALDSDNASAFKVIKNFAMSGPTSLSKNMLHKMIYDDPSRNTSFFGALVISNFQSFYGDIYDERAFKQKYEKAEKYARDVNQRKIAKILPKDFVTSLDNDFLHEIKHNPESSFKFRLSQSDIIPWHASAPIVLSYSKGDKSIPPKDTLGFYRLMKDMGNDVSIRKSSYLLTHRINFIPSVILMARDLKKL